MLPELLREPILSLHWNWQQEPAETVTNPWLWFLRDPPPTAPCPPESKAVSPTLAACGKHLGSFETYGRLGSSSRNPGLIALGEPGSKVFKTP